ncbi:MAG TPA: hypothetical protein VG406_10630 [Isosphaeraceae bacterium]|jgi:hypothetical protein|nr:hypothetical protein [Isosphaeraceae bacterium]
MITTTRRILVALALAVALGSGMIASACPNCKEAVAEQGDGQAARLRDGYAWSIILMVSAPFSLIGAGGFVVARAARRGSLPEL